MSREAGTQSDPAPAWRWTLIAGWGTLLLAIVAFFVPEIEWIPRGGLVGWLLVIAGGLELALATRRGGDTVGQSAIGSGLITAAAGMLFVVDPAVGYFPIANFVMLWLFVRGASVLTIALLRGRRRQASQWLVLTGTADVLLALLLLGGLPVTALVYLLFGPTRTIVAAFAVVLAVSFLVTAISQIAIALTERQILANRGLQ